MNILVIDTATESCSVALELEGGKQFYRFEICPQEHSRKLLPMVQSVLQEAQIGLKELGVLGVGVGPGSFTGVRIAMGMIQGLSFGASLPIVKVSTLQALAQETQQAQGNDTVISLIDARMSEVYFGRYQVNDEGVMILQGREAVLPPEVVITEHLCDCSPFGTAGTGWHAYEPLQPYLDGGSCIKYPNALYMLPMAKQQYRDKCLWQAADVEPTYLRDKVTWKKLPGR